MTEKILSLILVFIFIFSLSACTSTEEPASNSEESIPYSSSPTASEVDKNKERLESWELRLINKWNALPEGFKPELTAINTAYTRGGSPDYYFDSRAVGALEDLCKASKQDGVNLIVISPYRTNAKQQSLFNREVEEVKRQWPNMTQEEAEIKAATEVARPWTSEHQLGLAVDFNSVEESFDKTKEYDWLVENAHLYGFILRYPKNKEEKTAVIYEPWHYRYVGIENAKEIKESGLCLEEWIEQIKAD